MKTTETLKNLKELVRIRITQQVQAKQYEKQIKNHFELTDHIINAPGILVIRFRANHFALATERLN